MKVLVTYDTKYGNTKKVAELIADGINTIAGNETVINHIDDIDTNKDETYDLLLIGSPNHMGSHTKIVKKFIKKLAGAPLKGNSFAVFDTYLGKDFEKASKKMEKQISETMPDLNKASPGLSIKVTGMKGPILEEDLPKCREFGIKLAK
ncbi:MAG: flavodoxin family protein [Candidatus Hermodarchaeota archaeon]